MFNKSHKCVRPSASPALLGLALLPLSINMAMANTVPAPPSYGTALHGVPLLPPYLGNDAFEVDGVSGFPTLTENQSSYALNVTVTNLSDRAATLAGWIDYDGNGVFDAREAAIISINAGANDEPVTLSWNSLNGVFSGFTGQTYARLRISTELLTAAMPTGVVADGEVEDYSLFVQVDANGDGVPDDNSLMDPDQDGLVNALDLDSDNDTIPDEIEGTGDSDRDGVPDYLDLDSDNDGISDIRESGYGFAAVAALDTNGDGQVDPWVATGNNGLTDLAETEPDSGVLNYTVANTDGEGLPDYLDLDSDNDQISDLVESGGVDVDNNGIVDAFADSNNNGIIDSVDVGIVGGQDSDGDGIVDTADADFVLEDDTDLDGIVDSADPDFNGDGFVDVPANSLGTNGSLPDTDADGIPDFLDITSPIVTPPNDDVPNPASGPIETGLRGSGGCTINGAGTPGTIDPALPLLVVMAAFWVGLRRRLN